MDYSIFYKQEHDPNVVSSIGPWDLFLSAFTTSDRAARVFNLVQAGKKVWLLHSEYDLSASVLPQSDLFRSAQAAEADYVGELFEWLRSHYAFDAQQSLCIDITGVSRPHLLFLLRYMKYVGVKKFDALYSEPVRYIAKEDTKFAQGDVYDVRQVNGFEGIVSVDQSSDTVIIGAGYDDALISEVAEEKDKAEKVLLFGFPPLRADMYQENLLRARKAADSLGGEAQFPPKPRLFSPANDPFVTASVLSQFVERRGLLNKSNLYLSPLGTKVQALGFGIFYLTECIGKNTSIIFPFSEKYNPETTVGLSRIWQYTVEL